jgi:hypothetical protein
MKQDQIAARATMARELIEAGLSEPAIVRRLQLQFGIVKSTCYLDIRKANDEILKSDDGPSSAEITDFDTAGMIAALLYDAQRCQESGDYVAMQRCVKSADTLRRWGGTDVRLR